MFAGDDFFKSTNGFLDGNIFAGHAGELFGHKERLAEETLNLAGACHCKLVIVRQFFHTKNGNDILKFLVALQDFLNTARSFVMFLTDHVRIHDPGSGIERVHCGIDTQFGNLAGQNRRRIQMGKRCRRRRVGQIVSRNINRLNRSDGTFLCRGNPFLQGAHVRTQGGLVTDGGRHAAEKCGYF